MIGIALDVNHLRNRILRFVAEGVNDDAAAHAAIWAGAARLASPRNLQALGLRVDRSQIESKRRQTCATDYCAFEKGPAGELHRNLQHPLRALGRPWTTLWTTETLAKVEGCGQRVTDPATLPSELENRCGTI